MSKNYELYKELLKDFEEVSRKLQHYQSNAYHFTEKVAYYEKAWSENDPALAQELASTVAEESFELSPKVQKKLDRFKTPGGTDGV
jgi:hypothetical protein